MKHFKIINFDAKIVEEFDIKDNEIFVWYITRTQPVKMNNPTVVNCDCYPARESDLK